MTKRVFVDAGAEQSKDIPWKITFDALGHCTACHLDALDIQRVDRLIIAQQARSRVTHPVCGHVLVYQSIGTWTAFVRRKPLTWK